MRSFFRAPRSPYARVVRVTLGSILICLELHAYTARAATPDGAVTRLVALPKGLV